MNAFIQKLAAHPFFYGMRDEHLQIMAANASERTCAAGTVIFREHEPAAEFFFIQSGCVQIEDPESKQVIAELHEGDVLGWSWLFPPFAWHFQARAAETSRLIVLDGSHLLVRAERDKEFGYQLMKRIAEVVVHRLQSARQRLVMHHAICPAKI